MRTQRRCEQREECTADREEEGVNSGGRTEARTEKKEHQRMRESDRGKGVPGSSRPTSMAEEGVPAVVAMQGGRVRGGAGGKPFTTASKRERGDSHECKRRCRRRNGENGNHRVAEEGWLLRRPRFHTEQRRSYEESISSTSSSGVTTLGTPLSFPLLSLQPFCLLHWTCF